MKKVISIALILGVALVGVLVWGIMTVNELLETKEALASTKSQLEMTTGLLEEANGRLVDTEKELAATSDELSKASDELSGTRSELSSTKSELTSTHQQLTVARETLSGLGISLSESKACYDVELIDNPEATNPTWNELIEFLSKDRTETHNYIENVYDCSQFSRDVHNNAEADGIRTAEVHIEFSNQNVGHALNAFLTTDYGLVYVDCVEGPDTVVRVTTGKKYRAVEIYSSLRTMIKDEFWWNRLDSYYYVESNTGGQAVVSGITIFW